MTKTNDGNVIGIGSAIPIADVARDKYQARQREGHKMPDWDGLSADMQAELIFREQSASERHRQMDKKVLMMMTE